MTEPPLDHLAHETFNLLQIVFCGSICLAVLTLTFVVTLMKHTCKSASQSKNSANESPKDQ